MRDIIQDLCANLREYESALANMRASAKPGRAAEMARITRDVELCERWLRVAGGEEALARMRAESGPLFRS
ncbi:MAG: hypothetical protein IT492_07170 [Gammaproteobacteria bacterium]|nr:hypothetical protein [Gammaproteobacteria bacterium]